MKKLETKSTVLLKHHLKAFLSPELPILDSAAWPGTPAEIAGVLINSQYGLHRYQ